MKRSTGVPLRNSLVSACHVQGVSNHYHFKSYWFSFFVDLKGQMEVGKERDGGEGKRTY